MKSPASFSIDCLSPGPILVADPAFEDVKHQLEADVDVRIGHPARRNRRHVHRQLGRADVLGTHAGLVLDVIPAPAIAARADHADSRSSFHAFAQVDVGLLRRGGAWRLISVKRKTGQNPA